MISPSVKKKQTIFADITIKELNGEKQTSYLLQARSPSINTNRYMASSNGFQSPKVSNGKNLTADKGTKKKPANVQPKEAGKPKIQPCHERQKTACVKRKISEINAEMVDLMKRLDSPNITKSKNRSPETREDKKKEILKKILSPSLTRNIQRKKTISNGQLHNSFNGRWFQQKGTRTTSGEMGTKRPSQANLENGRKKSIVDQLLHRRRQTLRLGYDEDLSSNQRRLQTAGDWYRTEDTLEDVESQYMEETNRETKKTEGQAGTEQRLSVKSFSATNFTNIFAKLRSSGALDAKHHRVTTSSANKVGTCIGLLTEENDIHFATQEDERPRKRERGLQWTQTSQQRFRSGSRTPLTKVLNSPIFKKPPSLKSDSTEIQQIKIPASMIKPEKDSTYPEQDDYTVLKTIGRGSYAVVNLGLDRRTNRVVALKTYAKSSLDDTIKISNVLREVKILSSIYHPRIIQMFGCFETPTEITIVLEYIGSICLADYLRHSRDRRLEEPEACRLVYNVLEALHYLHSNNIIHRDLKLENLLLDHSRNLKLIDFGFAEVTDSFELHKLYCGTPSYMPPEIVTRTPYSGKPVDMWAVGILTYKLLTGCFPFVGPNDDALFANIAKCSFPLPDYISNSAQNFIASLLIFNPRERLTVDEAIEHFWFDGC
eukprot:TRINITY_DN2151_c0_g1_i12.p1 TRINITY_DN2151_c0_g1~~TRINITY_DN2151_c0_g1_i12.p1  ORF type:complete len:658 (+),score=80.69 TRINITY_DN2151_c0_g1_i12:131-2104(+)